MELRLSHVITRRNPIPFAMMLAACWTRSGCLATHGNRVDMADQNGALLWRSFHRVLETEVSYGGTPKSMVYNGNSMEFLLRLMIWVYHHFRKPPNKWMKIVSGDSEDSSTVSLFCSDTVVNLESSNILPGIKHWSPPNYQQWVHLVDMSMHKRCWLVPARVFV